MGQYYKPTFLDDNADVTANDWDPIKFQLSPYDFGEGAKLMEHSYVGGRLVQAVEFLLAEKKDGIRFVWAGDYADKFPGFVKNLYDVGGEGETDRKGLSYLFFKDVLATEHSWKEFYRIKEPKTYKWVVNHTKRLFVAIPQENGDELVIHPLPLLTAESNGRGGGDYAGDRYSELVGSWKYDRISVCDDVPKGYTELKVNFNSAD